MANHSEFYATYLDVGHSTELIVLHGGRWLLSVLGLSINLVLVAATVKSKNLHHRCNILIAAEACANMLYQVSPSVTVALALSGLNLAPMGECLWLQSLPLFGVHVSIFCSFAIGLDRLVSVRMPWMNLHNYKRLLRFLLGGAVVYGLLHLVWCHWLCAMYLDLHIRVMCTLTVDCYQGLHTAANCAYSAIALNIATVVVYVWLWTSVKKNVDVLPNKQQGDNAPQLFTQRILKSLLLITCVNVCGWTVASFWRLADPLLPIRESNSVLLVNAISYLTILTSATSGPVLYVCSEEYRKAIRTLLHWSTH